MALISCPECHNSISDKAKACIHCGYPLELINSNVTKEVDYFLMDTITGSERGRGEYKKYWLIRGTSPDCNIFVGDKIDVYENEDNLLGTYTLRLVTDWHKKCQENSGTIPDTFFNVRSLGFDNPFDERIEKAKYVVAHGMKVNLERNKLLYNTASNIVENNAVRCPNCKSYNIQLIRRKWSMLTGFMTNKIDRVCVDCKTRF